MSYAYVVTSVLVWSTLASLLSLNHTHIDYRGLLSIFWWASMSLLYGSPTPPPPPTTWVDSCPKNTRIKMGKVSSLGTVLTCWSSFSPSESANFFPSRTIEGDPVKRSCLLLWMTSPDQLVKALQLSHCSWRANGWPCNNLIIKTKSLYSLGVG